MVVAIGIMSRSTVAGRTSGRTSVRTGTATKAKPKPTEPCTTAPNPTATNKRRNSN